MGRVVQRTVTLRPEKKGIYLFTRKLHEEVPELKEVEVGMCNIFLKATDAALTINENADPTVRSDMEGALQRIASAVAHRPNGEAAALTSLVGGLYLADFTGASSTTGRELVVTITEAEEMKDSQTLTVKAPSRGCHLTTTSFQGLKLPSMPAAEAALLNLFIRHTSASLTISENADPLVRTDMEAALNHIVPEAWNDEFFEHTMEGPDDMPAHVKSSLLGASVSIPLRKGHMQLGTWQGVYLCEHRDIGGFGTGHAREVTATVHTAPLATQTSITVQAPNRGCHDITTDVEAAVRGALAGVRAGVLNVFIQHTSASLTVADTAAAETLEEALNAVVPERWNREFFQHTYEGDDDMPGHVKCSLMGASLSVPVKDGKLHMAPNQALLLCEHRNMGGWGGGHQRTLVLTVLGDPR